MVVEKAISNVAIKKNGRLVVAQIKYVQWKCSYLIISGAKKKFLVVFTSLLMIYTKRQNSNKKCFIAMYWLAITTNGFLHILFT